MDIFKRLNYQEIVSYQVPKENADNPMNLFFGIERNQFDLDGPWPFLAFRMINENPKSIAFNICDIHPESLEYENFNPLVSSGYLYLTVKEFHDLFSIIRETGDFYFPGKAAEVHGLSFRRIKGKELAKLRIDDQKFPNSKQVFYIQDNDTTENSGKFNTLLLFSWALQQARVRHISFQIMRFTNEMLKNPNYNPRDHGIAMINLDRKGMNHLIIIFSEIINQISN